MKHSAFALSLALFSTAATAQQSDAPTFSPDAARAHIAFLADDLMEGRDTGTRGYDMAAHYVATQFDALGLKPAGKDGWYQPITFHEARRGDGAVLTIGDQRFPAGTKAYIGPNMVDTQQVLEAPIVFAGYGLHAPEQGIDEYAGLDVKGKFVAVLSGFPKGMASDIGAHLNAEKAKAAQDRGAIGIITIWAGESEKASPFARVVEMSGRPSVTWLSESGEPFRRTPLIQASAMISAADAQVLFAGSKRNIKSILAEAARPNGRPKGFALKPNAKIERESSFRALESANVLGVLPGSDPALAGEYVVLLAHLDHEGVKPEREGDKIYNGAMDNAAGISTMIEVARAMAKSPARPKRSILFAAVTAEEKGLVGSHYLATHPVIENAKPIAVVNLDMPILLYDFTDVVAFGAEHSTLGPIVAKASASMGVSLSPDPMPAQGLFTRSDHYNFVREGVPAVFLMTGFANGGEKMFSDFLANNYHKPSDQIDLPFNWDAAAKFAKINYLIANEIANAPAAPKWYDDSFFGKVFASDAPKASRAAQ